MTGALVRVVCAPTGKQVYCTLGRALFFATRVEAQTGRPYRVYQCDRCGFWHLTSRRRWRE